MDGSTLSVLVDRYSWTIHGFIDHMNWKSCTGTKLTRTITIFSEQLRLPYYANKSSSMVSTAFITQQHFDMTYILAVLECNVFWTYPPDPALAEDLNRANQIKNQAIDTAETVILLDNQLLPLVERQEGLVTSIRDSVSNATRIEQEIQQDCMFYRLLLVSRWIFVHPNVNAYVRLVHLNTLAGLFLLKNLYECGFSRFENSHRRYEDNLKMLNWWVPTYP